MCVDALFVALVLAGAGRQAALKRVALLTRLHAVLCCRRDASYSGFRDTIFLRSRPGDPVTSFRPMPALSLAYTRERCAWCSPINCLPFADTEYPVFLFPVPLSFCVSRDGGQAQAPRVCLEVGIDPVLVD